MQFTDGYETTDEALYKQEVFQKHLILAHLPRGHDANRKRRGSQPHLRERSLPRIPRPDHRRRPVHLPRLRAMTLRAMTLILTYRKAICITGFPGC